MKRSTLGFVFLVSAALLSSCSKKGDSAGTQTYLIPWLTESGETKVQNVEIKTFNQASKLKGEWARILVGPKGVPGGLDGSTPVGRFIVRPDGVKVPADLTTLEATTLYAHYERLHDLDVKMGVATPFVWPATVGIKVNYSEDGLGSRNDAYYDANYNATILVQYTDKDLPLVLNPGVLAHEHFHAIFQERVLNVLAAMGKKPVQDLGNGAGVDSISDACRLGDDGQPAVIGTKKNTIKLARPVSAADYNRFLLRAINEGLADYWGWLYSGDTKFVSRSLPVQVGSTRNLDESNIRYGTYKAFGTASSLKQWEQDHGFNLTGAYGIGTKYALFLKRLADSQTAGVVTAEEAKTQIARAMLIGLTALTKQIAADFDKTYIEPESIVKPFFDSLPAVNQASCGVYIEAVGPLKVSEACKSSNEVAPQAVDFVTDTVQ